MRAPRRTAVPALVRRRDGAIAPRPDHAPGCGGIRLRTVRGRHPGRNLPDPPVRHAAPAGVVLALLLLLAACSSTDGGNPQRDAVIVPADADVVRSLAWDEVESMTPLNRRMILFRTRGAPHLLVLEQPCQGLRSDSMILTRNEDRRFDPQEDRLWAADPVYSGTAPYGFTEVVPGGAGTAALMDGAVLCRPDTLYAIREDDVAELRAALSPDR